MPGLSHDVHVLRHTTLVVPLELLCAAAENKGAQDKLVDIASMEKTLQQVTEYTDLLTSSERAVTAPLAASMAAAVQARLTVSSSQPAHDEHHVDLDSFSQSQPLQGPLH